MGMSAVRTRWAAIGAAVAVALGAGGIGMNIGHATTGSGDRPIFTPIEPCRMADLRPAPDTVGPRPAPLAGDETYTLDGWGAVGNCNLPTGTSALAVNVTAVTATAPTFLTLFPAGTALPLASHLNPAPGQPPTPNAVNVKLNGSGEFSIYNKNGDTSVIIDVVGIYDHHTHDDRYYGKNQVDAKIGQIASDIDDAIATQPWSESMPIEAAYWFDGIQMDWIIASGGSKSPDGIRLNAGQYGRFWHGFTLPPAYQAGSDVRVRVTWMAEMTNTLPCVFLFEDNGTTALRPGQIFHGVAVEFADPHTNFSPAQTLLTATNEGNAGLWTDNTIHDTSLILDGANLAAGDHVRVTLARRGTDVDDTCDAGMTVLGLNAEPA